MHILNHFVTAQCFLSRLFYPDAERVIWICRGNSELAYCGTRSFRIVYISLRSEVRAILASVKPNMITKATY